MSKNVPGKISIEKDAKTHQKFEKCENEDIELTENEIQMFIASLPPAGPKASGSSTGAYASRQIADVHHPLQDACSPCGSVTGDSRDSTPRQNRRSTRFAAAAIQDGVSKTGDVVCGEGSSSEKVETTGLTNKDDKKPQLSETRQNFTGCIDENFAEESAKEQNEAAQVGDDNRSKDSGSADEDDHYQQMLRINNMLDEQTGMLNQVGPHSQKDIHIDIMRQLDAAEEVNRQRAKRVLNKASGSHAKRTKTLFGARIVHKQYRNDVDDDPTVQHYKRVHGSKQRHHGRPPD